MKQTLREKFIKGLLALGYRKVASASSKYEVYTHDSAERFLFFFVGKSGSLRFSASRPIASSIPASDGLKAKIIAKGEAA